MLSEFLTLNKVYGTRHPTVKFLSIYLLPLVCVWGGHVDVGMFVCAGG